MKFAAAFLGALVLLPTVAADWSSFHNDSRNTGHASSSTYAPYQDLWWSVPAKDVIIDASPVVAGKYVLVAGRSGYIAAIDSESGSIVWAHLMTAEILSTPAVTDGRVFVVDFKGTLRALDLNTGAKLAETAVGSTLSGVTAHEGKVFVGNEAGEMKAFEAQLLSHSWTFKTNSVTFAKDKNGACDAKGAIVAKAIRGTPAIFENKVYFGSLNNYVFAVNERGEGDGTTKVQWVNKTLDLVWASPTVDVARSRVVFGSYDQNVYSFEASPSGSGDDPCFGLVHQATWKTEIPSTSVGQSKVHSSPATDGQRIYFGTNGGQVVALDAATGARLWATSTGDAVYSSPAVSNNVVVVGSDDRNVYWLNATSGVVLKKFLADGQIKASPAIDGDRTFVSTFAGTTYMLGPKIPARPDLQVTAITNGDSLIVAVTNAGQAASAATAVRITVNGALIGDLPLPAMAVGATQIVQAAALPAGSHVVVATVDPASLVLESTESNNEFTQAITVAAPPASKKDDGFLGVPSLGLPFILACLAAALFVLRRRD